MELQEKIQRAMDARFIGDIPFDEEELDELKADCQRFYRQVQGTWSKIYRPEDIDKLIVLIVNISKSWGDDKESRFWVKQFGEIFDDATVAPVKFYDEFEKALRRHNKALFLSKEGKRMFREVFLLHAFAPDKSGDSFVRLLWNWFIDADVLDFDYQPNDPLYQKIAAFLSAKFSGETNLDEDSSFEGKTYAIRSSFKYLFTQDAESGVWLLDKLFADFDDIYYNGRYDSDSYFAAQSYEIVHRVLEEENETIKHRKRTANEHIVSDYSKIYAAYELDAEGNVAIYLPEIRAIDETAEEYRVEIYNDDSLVYTQEGYIVGNELKRRIKRISVPLNALDCKPKEAFRFRVILYVERDYGDERIFDSDEHGSLYREFVLFRANREIKLATCKPDTYQIARPYSVSLEDLTNCAVHNVNAYLSSIVAQDGDYICGQTQQVFFGFRPKESHTIIEGKASGLLFRRGEQEYPHYRKVETMTVLLDSAVDARTITINVAESGQFYPLSNVSQADGNKYIVDLVEIGGADDGVHTINVSDSARKKLLHKITYYVEQSLSLSVNNDYVFDKDVFSFFIQRNDDDDCRKIYEGAPRRGSEEIAVEYADGSLVYPVPYIKWRIDNGDWQYGMLGQNLWKGEEFLHNNCVIEVENTSKRSVALYINESEILPSANGRYRLGDALTENARNGENDVSLCVGKKQYTLFTVYNRPYLDDNFDIDLERKTISFVPYYCGDPSSRFHVELDGENHYDLVCGINGTFDETIADGEYTVRVYLLDFFGEDGELLMEEDFILGNPDKICFAHSRIVLTKFKNPNGGKIALNKTYITDLEYLREESYVAVYKGTLNCQKSRYQVEVYKKDDNNLRFFFVDGDALLPVYYDKKQNTFTKKESDDALLCSSCYYTKEEY